MTTAPERTSSRSQDQHRWRRRVGLLTLMALVLAGAGSLAACGGQEPSKGGPVTLTVATFGEFGYDGLYAEYEKSHPGIKIVARKAGGWEQQRDNLYTKLAAGSGLSDIEAVEGSGMPAMLGESDAFTDLADPSVKGRWLDWVQKAATAKDGKLIGYGTDIGPEAICYRSDLFKKAGLPTDRAQVAKLFGTWDDYFAVGRKFVKQVPGTAWYDSSKTTAMAMVNQLAFPFEDAHDKVIAASNPDIRRIFDTITANHATGLSTNLDSFSDDWVRAFQKNGFATVACPGWMLGMIQGNAAGVKGWDIADVFPGGGGNWGGSFLTVPKQSAHPKEAKELAAWLTAPEQQIKAFKAKGTYPSQMAALKDPALLDQKSAFFNNAPTGQIFANRAHAVTVLPHMGVHYADIRLAFESAVLRVDQGQQSPLDSWNAFTSALQRIH